MLCRFVFYSLSSKEITEWSWMTKNKKIKHKWKRLAQKLLAITGHGQTVHNGNGGNDELLRHDCAVLDVTVGRAISDAWQRVDTRETNTINAQEEHGAYGRRKRGDNDTLDFEIWYFCC